MKFLETSAKDGINIEETFTNLVVEMKKSVPAPKPYTNIRPVIINPNEPNPNKKKTCC